MENYEPIYVRRGITVVSATRVYPTKLLTFNRKPLIPRTVAYHKEIHVQKPCHDHSKAQDQKQTSQASHLNRNSHCISMEIRHDAMLAEANLGGLAGPRPLLK